MELNREEYEKLFKDLSEKTNTYMSPSAIRNSSHNASCLPTKLKVLSQVYCFPFQPTPMTEDDVDIHLLSIFSIWSCPHVYKVDLQKQVSVLVCSLILLTITYAYLHLG